MEFPSHLPDRIYVYILQFSVYLWRTIPAKTDNEKNYMRKYLFLNKNKKPKKILLQ